MKILLTGSTGFIGKNLVGSLLKKGYEVHVIVRKNSDISVMNKNVTIFEYDNNIESLIEFFKVKKFDGIVHLASLFLSSHKVGDIRNLLSSNIEFGTELLEAATCTDVKWFINTGTFWQNYENKEYSPVNLYAATKEAFEKMAMYYAQTSNLIFTTLRLNDTFGPNDTRAKIFNLWNKISKSGEKLEMSEGEQLIDIIYIEDVINAYLILIEQLSSKNADKFKNEIFALKSNERMQLKELANLFEKVTQTKLNIVWGAREYRTREVMIPWTDGQLLPNWKQQYKLEPAIKKTMETMND